MVRGQVGGGSGGSLFQIANNYNDNKDEDDDYSVFERRCIEAANKRIRLTPKKNVDQVRMAEDLLNLPAIGLKLNSVPSWVSSVERYLKSNGSEAFNNNDVDYGFHPIPEKLKASNFPASLLRIGSWERVTRNEGDLVGKCYYAKKKLVWEFLDRGLKSKIEIPWADILSLRADIKENMPAILEIELSKPPTFHEETDPQPRKHTMWRLTTDFTGGEASKWRRHYLNFPPGSLDKHYENLLQCDARLNALSRQPFPSLQSPMFETIYYGNAGFSFDYNGRPLDMNLGMQRAALPAAINPPRFLPNHHRIHTLGQTNLLPSFKETPSPISDDHRRQGVYENPRMGSWGPQAMNNANPLQWGQQRIPSFTDGMVRNQAQAPQPAVSHTQLNPQLGFQNYSLPTYGQAGESERVINNLPEAGDQNLHGFEGNILSEPQVGGSEYNIIDKHDMSRVASFGVLPNPSNEVDSASQGLMFGNPNINELGINIYPGGSQDESNLTFYGQDMSRNTTMNSMDGTQSQEFVFGGGHGCDQAGNEIGSNQLIYQQHPPMPPYMPPPPQVATENPMVHYPWTNMSYPNFEDFDGPVI